MGNGSEEFEVGFWALRDIRAGEEVCERCCPAFNITDLLF